MKVVFDNGIMNERGTTNAVFDYAKYGKELLNIEPIILYEASKEPAIPTVLKRFSDLFEVIEYKSEDHKVDIVKSLNPDVFYKTVYNVTPDLKWVPGAFNACHAVFTFDEPM